MLFRLTAKALLASAALTLLSLGAHAAGDPAKGEMKFYTCYGCHGIANYRNAYPDYSVPMLRHQNAELHDQFKAEQAKVWNQQQQIAVFTAPNAINETVKVQQLDMVPQFSAERANWIVPAAEHPKSRHSH